MGESACWLHLVCPSCGRVVAERSEEDGPCPQCREAEGRAPARGEDPEAAGPPEAPPTTASE